MPESAVSADARLALLQQIEILYADHHGWLRGWLRKRLGNAFDAADVAHDTYLRIMRSGRLPGPDESQRYLTRIANGLVVDLYRRRRIEAAYLEAIASLPAPLAPSEETRALAMEALLELAAILHALPAKARTALPLRRLASRAY
jgi:RNA polymerase sigma-70 factor (ECF subfamily)